MHLPFSPAARFAAFWLIALSACGQASTATESTGADTSATADSAVTPVAPTWPTAPTAVQTLGQGQTRDFALALDRGSANTVQVTLQSPANLDVALAEDATTFAVHADYDHVGKSDIQLHLAGDNGLSSDAKLALNVTPIHWGDATQWTSDGPQAREHGSVILDVAHDRVLLLGGSGYKPYGTPLNDAWAFDLATSTWTELKPTGDALGVGASRRVALIPGQQIAYLWGGYGANQAGLKELWRVDYSAEQPVLTKLKTTGGPSGRSLHTFAYDAPTDRFFVFGGVDMAPRNDLWVMTLDGDTASWFKQTVTGGPTPRYGFFYGVDAERGRLILYSGAQGTATLDPAQDTWELDLRASEPTWQKLAEGTADGVPPGRRNGCAVWDPTGPRLLVFGGTADAKTTQPGLFAFDARPGKAKWTELKLANEPDLRSSGFGAFDVQRQEALLGFGNSATAVYSDWNRLVAQ